MLSVFFLLLSFIKYILYLEHIFALLKDNVCVNSFVLDYIESD